MRVAAISTWRVNCGVAKYFEELAYPLSKLCELRVFAEDIHQQPQENEPLCSEPINVSRCWRRGKPYDHLKSSIDAFKPDVVLIEFQDAMYWEDLKNNNTQFIQMVKYFQWKGYKVFITLHDVIPHSPGLQLGWYSAFKDVHFLLTNDAERQEFVRWAPFAKYSIIPLGATIFDAPKNDYALVRNGFPISTGSTYDIMQPGFWGADKGMLGLIEQMSEVNKDIHFARLLFVGSIHPLAPQEHKEYVKMCLKAAMKAKERGAKIEFIPKFIPDNDLNVYLSEAQILVLNHTQIYPYVGASAIAKRILCAGKPLIFSSLDPRLSEFTNGINCLKINGKYGSFPDAVKAIYNDSALRERLITGAREYAMETSFENVAKKHIEVFENG